MSVTRVWAVALCALCLTGGALAAVALATPARRSCRTRHAHCATHACRSTRAHRCPRSRHPTRKPSRHGSSQRTPARPSGSAGKANPSPSTPLGSSAPLAGGAPLAGSSPASGEPTAESPTPAGPPSPARVQVTAKEWSFTLSRSEVPAGEVIVEFLNRGEDSHNLHLLEAAESSEAGAFPNTAPDALHDLKLKLHAGSYTLFCSLPEHEAKGMKATLIVR